MAEGCASTMDTLPGVRFSGLTRVLMWWLGVGFAWLLLGMFVLPTSKLYQQGLILLFWLPGLVALVTTPAVRRAWDPLLLLPLLVFALWSGGSVVWGGELDKLKEMLYVGLAVNAVVALAALKPRLPWQLLLGCALCGGGLAWWALVDFYFLQGNVWAKRVLGNGQLNQTILASQVMGVMGLSLLFMRSWLPRGVPSILWLLSCLGYLAFLVMSQSKGPLLALLVCLAICGLWTAQRWAWALGVASLVIAGLGVWLLPEQLLRGGFSYRPQLLEQAWELWLHKPWAGLGVGVAYLLPIPELGKSFEHAHNLYVHIALQLGLGGLFAWLALQGLVAWRCWSARGTAPGMTLCALWCFAFVALLTDGIGPWVKPREEWFTEWLPILLAFALYASSKLDECAFPRMKR